MLKNVELVSMLVFLCDLKYFHNQTDRFVFDGQGSAVQLMNVCKATRYSFGSRVSKQELGIPLDYDPESIYTILKGIFWDDRPNITFNVRKMEHLMILSVSQSPLDPMWSCRIQSLNLSNIQMPILTDLSYLKSFTQLHSLILFGSKLLDVAHLSELKSIKHLDLGFVEFIRASDYHYLASMHSLTSLNLQEADLGALESVQHLVSLKRLNLSNTHFHDGKPLRQLKNLVYLDLSSSMLQECQCLSSLVQLKYLNLSYTLLRDITPLGSLTRLTALLMRHCLLLQDISPLQSMHRLLQLDLSECPLLEDCSPLQHLHSLLDLNLCSTHISKLDPLQYLIRCKYLDVFGCPIVNMDAIQHLTLLVSLNVGHTLIASVEPCKYLKHLQYLDLSGAALIRDISPLYGLTELKVVRLEKTDIHISDTSQMQSRNVQFHTMKRMKYD